MGAKLRGIRARSPRLRRYGTVRFAR
jgi:hypothetical protein